MKHKGRKMRRIYIFSTLLILFAFPPNFLFAAEGDARWQISLGNSIDSSPAIGPDGTIYVGSVDGNLYAVNSNGTLKWTFKTLGEVHSSPAIGYDGTIYCGSDDSNLYAVNPDGSQKWVFSEATAAISSSPAIDATGTIYVGSEDGKLYAIKSGGTSELNSWPFSADGAITSSPVIASDGTVYVGSEGGTFYAIRSTGKLKWQFPGNNTVGSIHSSPAIDSDGTIYFGSADSNLYAVTVDGAQKWAFDSGARILSSPVIREDGSILAGCDNGNLYALKKDDGTQIWAYSLNGTAIRSAPLVASDGTIYFGADDQKLHVLNSSGSQKWELAGAAMISASPAMGFGGDLYIGTEGGGLYAVETASTRLASGFWPAFHHDARHTGRITTNAGPTADAGSDETVKGGNSVTLNGSNSSDPDFGIPLFTWTQTAGDTVDLINPTSVTPNFTAPGIDDEKKTLTFQLVVTDNGGLTDTDTVEITVEKNDDDKGCFIGTIRD